MALTAAGNCIQPPLFWKLILQVGLCFGNAKGAVLLFSVENTSGQIQVGGLVLHWEVFSSDFMLSFFCFVGLATKKGHPLCAGLHSVMQAA